MRYMDDMRAAPGKPSTRQRDRREELADSTNGFCERTPSKPLDEAICYDDTHALAQGTASAHSSIHVKRNTYPQRPQQEQPLNTFVAFLQDYANLESRKATQVRNIPGVWASCCYHQCIKQPLSSPTTRTSAQPLNFLPLKPL